MKIKITFLLIACALCAYGQKKVKKGAMDITVYHGSELYENAFLIKSKKGFVLIDALGSEEGARKILQSISGQSLLSVFITHGHPDHFAGLGIILKEYPDVAVYVATEDVKTDIIRYADFAVTKGLFDRMPSMKPVSIDPQGFDYKKIKVLNIPTLDVGDGNTLTIETMEGAAECAHNTILYSEEQKVLFASDLLYNKVFSWLGSGSDQGTIDSWMKALKNMKSRFGTGFVIYPGHGEKADHPIFDNNITYLTSFRNILCRTNSEADAVDFFRGLYPDYTGEFLLKKSIAQWIGSCSSQKHSISIKNILDLTHTLNADFPFIPVPGITFPFGIKPIATLEKNGVRANQWTIHEHLGTQFDAPNHFAANGIALEQINVRDLIVPVVVIDISSKSKLDADATLTVDDIVLWEKRYGRIPNNACVMMYSAWEKFLKEDKYLGLDQTHTKHFPGISAEAISFLIDERTISGVGVDVISIDPGFDNQYKGHKLLFSKNKWAVEAVANLHMVPASGAWLFVGAPKVEGATGGPVRLIAVWE